MTGPKRRPMMWGPIPPVPKPNIFPTPADDEEDKETADASAPEDGHPATETGTVIAENNTDNGGIKANARDTAEKEAVTVQESEEERAYPAPGPYPPPPVPPAGPPYQGYELARAYVPIQVFGPTYTPAEALEKGTLFPELWRPYGR